MTIYIYNRYMNDQLYCSVDLEFTGFDPSKEQILEVGFVFFRLVNGVMEVTEQWSQLFKPTIEVHPKIYGLTGITPEMLESAPEFSEFREFLQEKLGNAVLMAHNPTLDVKFLEAFGLKLNGKTIDTLELVQIMLPTHHSYNLENLVHFLGIKHSASHRALGDALSTVYVFEKMLQMFSSFDAKLQSELLELADSFEWTVFLR
jgi:DNA polymerase III epsilon subunit family exonuclease